ncbi:MAG: plasmid pRiA4b ORF-3 family protein [Actinomycetota bacterium]|nr:plasmid pRiA4b ORF-3 family protein [Actinomycetota bacterium]
MSRRPPPSPDLPPEVAAAIAAMNLDELRTATGQLLDLAGARARRRAEPEPTQRRRRRLSRPFSATVRVDLVGAKPPVWRRLELPSTLRLDELHGVLQAVFGWTDSHLHRFSLGDTAWDDAAEHFLCPYDVEEGENDGVPACDVRLDEVLAEPGDSLLYTYDYGDEWKHRLVLEQVGEPVDAVLCTDGRGAAPPEDSGGIWDWDADAAPPFDLAEAQAGLALWEVERDLPPEISQLLRHVALLPAEHVVRGLGEAADLDGTVTVDETTAEDTLRRYVWLLDRVGDGLPLTAAGWLPPAVVTEAMDALWPEDRWIGKRNREDLTEPVRRLRASAQRLGLLRVARGQMLVTKAGAGLRADPTRLWQHVAERLAGRPKDAFAVEIAPDWRPARRAHRRPPRSRDHPPWLTSHCGGRRARTRAWLSARRAPSAAAGSASVAACRHS